MNEPGLDYRALSFWVLAAQAAFNVIVMVVGWISLRRKATNDEIKVVSNAVASLQDALSKKCAVHQTRTTTLEEKAKNMPTHADLGAVHDRITAVKGGVDEVNGLLKGLRDNVNLLVDHHLRGEKR